MMDNTTSPVDLDDTPPAPQRSLAARTLLNGASVFVVCALILVSAPWWRGAVPATWTTIFPPPPYNGALLYGRDTRGHLLGLRLSNGRTQWQSTASDLTDPLVSAGVIVTTDILNHQTSGVAARTGKLLWQLPHNSAIVDGGVFGLTSTTAWVAQQTTGNTMTVLAVAVSSGHIAWRVTYLVPASAPEFPFVQGQHIVTVQVQGNAAHVIAYDAHSFQQQWDAVLPNVTLGQPTSPFFQCSPATRGIVCAVSAASATGSHLTSILDPNDGHILWRVQPQGGEIALTATTLYSADRLSPSDGESVTVHAYALDTGHLRWQHTYFGDTLVLANSAAGLSQILPGGVLPVLTPPGIAGIDAATGAITWAWAEPAPTTASPNWSNSFGAQGMLYFVAHDVVYAFDPATGHIIWNTSPLPKPPRGSTPPPHLQQCQPGPTLLICIATDRAIALDPLTGQVRWQQPQQLTSVQVNG